jgi:hypothetical protein
MKLRHINDAIMDFSIRNIAKKIQNNLQFNKVVIFFGARRVGKTHFNVC